jgi:hypothetical protein
VLGEFRVVEPFDLHRFGDLVAVGAVHQFQPVVDQVVAAEEIAPHADGPGRRGHVDGEVFLDLVDDLERVAASRSILLQKVRIGRSRRRQTSNSFWVWLSTPLAPSITMIAASTAVSVR